MMRSRRGLLGLLALVVVATLGLGGCSDPGVEGWHDVRPDAQPFTYGPVGCRYRAVAQPPPAGPVVSLVNITGALACNAPMAEIKILKVSCMYVGGEWGLIVAEVDGNTCPATRPGGTEPYAWMNAAYTQPPIMQS